MSTQPDHEPGSRPDAQAGTPRFTEVADRVWVAADDLGAVTVVGGERGLLLVDTGPGGADLPARVAAFGTVVAVALTHGHRGHTGGLPEVRRAWPEATVLAHEDAEVADVDRAFSSAAVVDLGDRVGELMHPGRGHSAGDVVVRLEDADVVVAGDLADGSGVLRYAPSCHPLDWPGALDLLVGLLTPGTVVVPGHGRLLGKDEVLDQREDAARVGATLRDLGARGVPADEALADAQWPFSAEQLKHAVRRGLGSVPPAPRQLPLV